MGHDEIRAFLADREGLTGSARTRFLKVLDQYDAFRRVRFRRTWAMLLCISILISGLCYLLDIPHRHWLDTLVWPGSLFLCIGPIWCIRRQEQRPPRLHGETEWRAYCQFLRPLILTEHPGLLDRNLASPSTAPGRLVSKPIDLLREQFKSPGLDYWWSALAGLWCAMITLLVLNHLLIEPSRWLALLLPVAGLLGGPLAGALGQSFVYRMAQKGAGSS